MNLTPNCVITLHTTSIPNDKRQVHVNEPRTQMMIKITADKTAALVRTTTLAIIAGSIASVTAIRLLLLLMIAAVVVVVVVLLLIIIIIENLKSLLKPSVA